MKLLAHTAWCTVDVQRWLFLWLFLRIAVWKTIGGEEHIEISRLGGWIDSVTDDLMGFIHTPVVRSCGLEKLQMIINEEPPESCTMI